MGKYGFHDNPFKNEILKMWDDGKNPYDVIEFLTSKGEDYIISKPTLYRHYNNYKKATKRETRSKDKAANEQAIERLKQELWDTIDACAHRLKDKSLSPKDWQYFDQQKQAAIEKLMKLIELKGSSDDASVILSKFFSQFKVEKALKSAGDGLEGTLDTENAPEAVQAAPEVNNGKE